MKNISKQASVDVQLFLFYKFEFLLYAWCSFEAIATQLQLPEEDQSQASRKYPPKTMHQYNIPFFLIDNINISCPFQNLFKNEHKIRPQSLS